MLTKKPFKKGMGPTNIAALFVPPAFVLAYQASAGSSDTTHTTVDYGTLSYGAGNTRVIAAIQWIPGGTISGVTVGGTALAQVSGAHNTENAGFATDVWESTAPLAGSSGDVQVTYTSAVSFTSAVALYKLVTTTPTAAAAQQGSQSFGTTVSTSSPISIPSGGGAIVLVIGANNTGFSFTNAAFDASVVAGGQTNNYYGHTTTTGSVTPGATWTGNNAASITAVAWSP